MYQTSCKTSNARFLFKISPIHANSSKNSHALGNALFFILRKVYANHSLFLIVQLLKFVPSSRMVVHFSRFISYAKWDSSSLEMLGRISWTRNCEWQKTWHLKNRINKKKDKWKITSTVNLQITTVPIQSWEALRLKHLPSNNVYPVQILLKLLPLLLPLPPPPPPPLIILI